MHRAVGRLVVALLCSASVTAAAEPDERTRAAARQLAQDGARALDEGRYAEAQDLLNRAYELYSAPTIAVLEARALVKLGRLVEAAEHYERARRTPLPPNASDAFQSAVAEANAEVGALRPRIPQLTIEIRGVSPDHPDLDVRLNGLRVPRELLGVRRPVDPGEHRVVARIASMTPVERVVTLAEQKQELVAIALDAPPVSALSTSPTDPMAEHADDGAAQRTWGYVSLGVGAAGVATGVIAGLVMLDKKSSLDDVCTPSCPPEAEGDLDSFRTSRTISLVGYGVGIVGLGVGAVLLLTAPSGRPERAGLSPWIDVAGGGRSLGVGMSGRFR